MTPDEAAGRLRSDDLRSRPITIDIHAPSALHHVSAPQVAWSTVNAAENIPGVMTPLGFDFWMDAVDLGCRGAFHAMGVIPRSAVYRGTKPEERFGAVFYGHFAGNVDQFRTLAELTPGTSGSAFEEQIFGSHRPDITEGSNWRRYPLVAVRTPVLFARLPRVIPRETERMRAWWRAFTDPARTDPAVDQLRDAADMTARVIVLQMAVSFAGTALYDKLGELARSVGRPHLQLELSTGFGAIEETRMVSMLHRVAHDGLPLSEFLAHYGARCAGENELSAHSWRERPEAVERLVRKYRDAPDRGDPLLTVDDRSAVRINAGRELLSLLPRRRRAAARLVVRLARTYVPLREEGKGLMAMGMDAGRCAARRRGAELVAAGAIDDADDVFLLTKAEILGDPPRDARELVTHRKALREAYEHVGIPEYWVGNPEPVTLTAPSDERVETVTGTAAAAGVVEGRARVMVDADGIDDLEDGEILVCRTTDPSWGAAFHLVSATVIDIGGTASHGAIVSRELGLPCVINTGNGTALLRTGDLLRVDGSAGVVTVLEPAPVG